MIFFISCQMLGEYIDGDHNHFPLHPLLFIFLNYSIISHSMLCDFINQYNAIK